MDNPLSQLGPWQVVGTEMGFGLLAGWCVGFAARKLTKLVAFVLGAFLIALQILVYKGLVNVNWVGMQAVYSENVPHIQSLWAILTANIPYSGAFAAGFFGGFRRG